MDESDMLLAAANVNSSHWCITVSMYNLTRAYDIAQLL